MYDPFLAVIWLGVKVDRTNRPRRFAQQSAKTLPSRGALQIEDLSTAGNPRGRPRNSRNLKTIIQGALTAPVVLREGARKRSISKLEGIVLKQIESALKGNEKAALATLKMAAQVGLLEAPEGALETPTLSASEQAMVNELVLQQRRRSKSRR